MFIFVNTKKLNLIEGMMILINEMVTVLLHLVFSFDSSSLVWAIVSGDVVERFVLFRPGNLRFIIQEVQLGQSPRIACVKHHAGMRLCL